MFVTYVCVASQPLPQCCKYLADELSCYLLYLQNIIIDHDTVYTIIKNNLQVNDEGFIVIDRQYGVFNMDNLSSCTPDELDLYVDSTRKVLSDHQKRMFKLLVRDRWYSGDFTRLRKMLNKKDVSKLITFGCNVLWERSYENHYTLGQQLSIRITTKLIQSGLDFKHQNNVSGTGNVIGRGWQDKFFEKSIAAITSISDVIKRHKWSKKYILLELLPQKADELIDIFVEENFTLIRNKRYNNVVLIQIDEDKNSLQYLNKFAQLIKQKIVNVIFVTDLEYYMKINNYLFYLYNSLKLYYYCLCDKFVFLKRDYEIIFLLNLIVNIEWHNGGHLNSFTLEKSSIYNPLELSTRRLNSVKRAAAHSRQLLNDAEIKIDFIKGKRIKTGTHYGHRIVNI